MRFVDTSFWVELQFRRDSHHLDAAAIWKQDPGPLITTNHVRGETWTFLRRRLGHTAACRFRAAVDASSMVVVRQVDEELEGSGYSPGGGGRAVTAPLARERSTNPGPARLGWSPWRWQKLRVSVSMPRSSPG